MEESDHIGQGLGKQLKRNPFVVPEGYFEGFAGRLGERMSREPQRGGRKILRPAYAIAGFCLLLIAGFFVLKLSLRDAQPEPSSETNMTAIIQYSLENIDEQTLIDALPGSDTIPSEISREDIINYLQDHNIDPAGLN